MMGVAGVLLLASSVALAQHGPGGGGGAPGGGMGGPGGPGGGFGGGMSGGANSGPNGNARGNSIFGTSTTGTSSAKIGHGALQLGPPGRWWDDKKFAQTLGLRTDQQKKMDAVFNANKGMILQRYETLQQEQARMEALTKESHLKEAEIFAQVDRVSQARAGLEKATAHLSLLLRQEMDPGQIARLEEQK